MRFINLKLYNFKTILLLISFTLSLSAQAFAKAKELIGGPLYQQGIQTKDLIADVLPPPGFIVESYLVTLRSIAEFEASGKSKKFAELRDLARQLKAGVAGPDPIDGYFTRIEFWKKELTDKGGVSPEIATILLEKSFAPANKFFALQDEVYLNLEKNKAAAAKKIAMGDMRLNYNVHRTELLKLVELAKKSIAEIENQSQKISKDKSKTKLKEIQLHGVLHKNILRLKDLIADVLPPPCFIVESHLLSWQMLFEVEVNGIKSPTYLELKKSAVELTSGGGLADQLSYKTRKEHWLAASLSPELRKHFNAAIEQADLYFLQRDKELFADFENIKIERAKAALLERFENIFIAHRKEVDLLVSEADKKMIQIERKSL